MSGLFQICSFSASIAAESTGEAADAAAACGGICEGFAVFGVAMFDTACRFAAAEAPNGCCDAVCTTCAFTTRLPIAEAATTNVATMKERRAFMNANSE